MNDATIARLEAQVALLQTQLLGVESAVEQDRLQRPFGAFTEHYAPPAYYPSLGVGPTGPTGPGGEPGDEGPTGPTGPAGESAASEPWMLGYTLSGGNVSFTVGYGFWGL